MRFESNTAAPLRPTWTTLVRGAFNLVLGAGLLFLAIVRKSGFLAMIALPAILLGVRTRLRPDRSWVAKSGTLVADERGILLDGMMVVERRHLVVGVVAPAQDGRPRVQLGRPWPRAPLFIEVASEAEGNALLAALELGASQAAVVFKLPSPTRRQGIPWFLLAALLVGSALVMFGEVGKLISLPIFLAALAITVVRSAIEQQVTVGADGILITWLSQRRFIAYHEVRSVRRIAWNEWIQGFRGPGVGITLISGEIVALPVNTKLTETEALAECELLAHRIQEAMAGAAPRGDQLEVSALQRGGRPVASWIRALRALGSGAAADHRIGAVPPESLLRIAEDSARDPLVRVGAAIALSASPAPEGRERVMALARAAASPRLRVVLELAGEGAGEEALAEEIDRLEAVGRARASTQT